MNDDSLQKLKNLRNRATEASDEQADNVLDFGMAGWLRGTKDHALFLDCLLKTGESIAFAYGLLEQVTFNPSEGITLVFMGRKVILKGTMLDKPVHGVSTLKDGFLRHRIPWIRESSKEGIMSSKEAGIQISQIQVE